MGTLTFQKLQTPPDTVCVATVIIDFRRDSFNFFVELTGQNYDNIQIRFQEFLEARLNAVDARDKKDDKLEMADVKYKITHLLRYTGTRNNMTNIYCTMSDFMTAEQGWELKSLT